MKTTLASAIALVSAVAIAADIKLPDPVRTGGKPLNEALAARQTNRDFSTAPLTDQELSDLLWAANGFNRPDQKKRTAPTAVNRQEVDIYVCRADGAYFWDSEANVLKQEVAAYASDDDYVRAKLYEKAAPRVRDVVTGDSPGEIFGLPMRERPRSAQQQENGGAK